MTIVSRFVLIFSAIDRIEESWSTLNPRDYPTESQWIEFKANGEYVERFSDDYQTSNQWEILGNVNLYLSASTDIPTGENGLEIRSLDAGSMHLYIEGEFGSFSTPASYHIYLSRLQ